MLNKCHRLLLYLKNVLLLLVLWPAAALLRRIRPSFRRLWLVAERGTDARDNGYWFYRYLREKHPEVNACYVIDPRSPDYGKVSALGPTVRMGSLRHYLMYLAADRLVSSHVQPAAPDLSEGERPYLADQGLSRRQKGRRGSVFFYEKYNPMRFPVSFSGKPNRV